MDRLGRTLCLVVGAMLAAAILLGAAAPAHAHSGEESYIYLNISQDSIEGQVELPISDVNTVLGLDLPDGGDGMRAAVDDEAGTIIDYAATHLQMANAEQTEVWPLVFENEIELLEEGTGSYVILPFEVDQEFADVPQRFTVTYDGIIESIDGKSGLLLIANDWDAGVFKNDGDHLLVFSAGNTTQLVDRDASFWTGFVAVIDLGAEHIRIGTDHILFVLALVLPSVLIFTRGEGWRAEPSFAASLWRVTKIATMFTIAHSVTLSLGGLGLVSLPARPVETFIALSIAAAAAHNFYPVFANKEWLLAFGFGLFHGLGFAGLLEDLGLSDNNRFWSLLGFNIGIELGQLVIIFLIFPVLFVLRRTRAYPWVFYGGSAALGIAALGWAMERGLDMPERVSPLVDPVFAWPRAFWVVLALGAVAVVYQRWEASHGRLRSLIDLLPGPAFQRHGVPPSTPVDDEAPPRPDDDLQPVG